MSVLDALLATIAPHDCLGCGAEGPLLCLHCQGLLRQPRPQCYRCRQPSGGDLTCSDCLQHSPLQRVQAAAVYDDHAKELVWRLKFNGTQAAAGIMARMMQLLIKPDTDTIIVPVLTATSRIRRRGYDQANLLARELSRYAKTSMVTCLVRQSHTHQVGATREQRLAQLSDAFRVTQPDIVRGARIILVDDVVTTGATLEAAAHVLRAAGASSVAALVFAQPRLRNLAIPTKKALP